LSIAIILPVCLAAGLLASYNTEATPAVHDSLGQLYSNAKTESADAASPLARPVLTAISVYQGIVSPQQGQVCAFEPTCSHFSQQALQRYGFIHGGLMTSDRLQRCHYCAAGQYIPGETGCSHDPVHGHCLSGDEPSPPWSLNGVSPPFSPLIAEDQRTASAFADHLASSGDFLHAYDQYLVMVSKSSGDSQRDWARLRAGLCLQQAGQWPQAQAIFEELSRGGIEQTASQEASFQSALTNYLAGDSPGTLQKTEALDGKPRGDLLAGWIHLHRGEWPAATTALAAISSSAPAGIASAASQLRNEAIRGPSLPHRSPTLAALFSTAIPGSGKMYAGKPLDGLYSLLLAASSIAVTSAYAGEQQWTRAGVFGAMGLYFYLGNIYGSAVEATRFNDRMRRSAFQDLAQSTKAEEWLWDLGEITGPELDLNSIETSFERAENLYAENRYDQAITEFRRHLFHFPGDNRTDLARYRIGLAYLQSGRWTKGRETLAALTLEATTEEIRYRSRFQGALSFLSQDQVDQSKPMLRKLLSDPLVTEAEGRAAEVQYWLGVCALKQRQWVEAAGIFHWLGQRSGSMEYRDGTRSLLRAAREGYQLPRRSPGLAAGLSMFVPGSGQIYAGHPWNGLISLVLNAGVGYLTVDAFRDDRHLDGGLLISLLWSRFYFGGIQNAARFAREYNERVAKEHLKTYEKWMGPRH
jgi:putative component of membrane protein insertase Oxa1/YidC/SpoIIIJ protein YidD/TolA-binding protein/TM2 domain-containing membrane protein YozV